MKSWEPSSRPAPRRKWPLNMKFQPTFYLSISPGCSNWFDPILNAVKTPSTVLKSKGFRNHFRVGLCQSSCFPTTLVSRIPQKTKQTTWTPRRIVCVDDGLDVRRSGHLRVEKSLDACQAMAQELKGLALLSCSRTRGFPRSSSKGTNFFPFSRGTLPQKTVGKRALLGDPSPDLKPSWGT